MLRLIRAAQALESKQSAESASARIDALRQLQRTDGGWSQTTDRPSDAFATGQTLYAFRAVGLTADSRSVQRGIEFLIRSQSPDGTWAMTSRPNPESGKPADFLNPITYAATVWATLGLTSHVGQ